MQKLYLSWCAKLPDGRISYAPSAATPSLPLSRMHALHRWTAEEYWHHRNLPNHRMQHCTRWGPVLVVSSRCDQALLEHVAQHVCTALGGQELNTTAILHDLRVLTSDVPPKLHLPVAFALFTESHVVFLHPPALAAAIGAGVVCSCAPFSLEGQCEHQVFAEALDLPGRPSNRNLSSTPQPKRRGRPTGTVTTRGQRSKAKAKSAQGTAN